MNCPNCGGEINIGVLLSASRMEKIPPEKRKEIATKAARARWDKRKTAENAPGETNTPPPQE